VDLPRRPLELETSTTGSDGYKGRQQVAGSDHGNHSTNIGNEVLVSLNKPDMGPQHPTRENLTFCLRRSLVQGVYSLERELVTGRPTIFSASRLLYA